jgi:hypothetical protein
LSSRTRIELPAFCVVALVGLPACGQVLGVDEYEVGATAAVGVTFPLPADPGDDVREECRACAEEHCSTQFTACMENPRCRAKLACSERCSNPNCLAECNDTLPPSPVYDVFFDCVFLPKGLLVDADASACTTECKVGRHLDCSKNYSWVVPRGTVTASVHIRDGFGSPKTPLSTVSGTSIAACSDLLRSDSAGCGVGTPTDYYGNASVRFPQGDDAFAITGGLDEHDRYYSRPVTGPGPIDLLVFDHDSFAVLLGMSGVSVNPNKGILFFGTGDCLGTGTNAAVEIVSPNAPAPYYFNENGTPALDNPPSLSGFFLDVDLPVDKTVLVQNRDPESGAIRTKRRVLVDRGWSTYVDFYPPISGE